MVSTFPAVQLEELYYRNLERNKILALLESKGNYEAPLHLSNESRSELAWWVNNVDSSFKPIVQGQPVVLLTTDVFARGLGLRQLVVFGT